MKNGSPFSIFGKITCRRGRRTPQRAYPVLDKFAFSNPLSLPLARLAFTWGGKATAQRRSRKLGGWRGSERNTGSLLIATFFFEKLQKMLSSLVLLLHLGRLSQWCWVYGMRCAIDDKPS